MQALGQDHLLRWWGELTEDGRAGLLRQIESLPWDAFARLIESHVRRRPVVELPRVIEPAPVMPHTPSPSQAAHYAEAFAHGRSLLRAGKVAAFTVAGGQGTRLGYDGPKGCVEVTPTGGTTLFELFAGMVAAARRKYAARVPWYVMTSPANHEATETYFAERSWFGLGSETVRLFPQAMLPAFDFSGRALLEGKDRLALAPDGHGGSLKALVASGSIAEMRSQGVEIISYFQVDNPLVKPFDPLFLGLHALTGSEMSTKVTPKADDLEKVGNICLADGKLRVIEYSDLPEELARARKADGSRKLDAGNLAIHVLRADFVERVAGPDIALPYRRAEKKVPYVDDQGRLVTPGRPNAVKLETFVFDALPLARNPLVLAVDRAEEFSPVKNASGADSLETSRRDQNLRACRWLETAGVTVPRGPDGTPLATVTILPSFALDAEDVADRRGEIPEIAPGASVVLS
jgi:UDP-N-acetylglucosamine/UDP-N-acetylgalactosamine diphosphorylase